MPATRAITSRTIFDPGNILAVPRSPEGKPRISVETWGRETAINDYAHCDHVILAGVVRRNRLDLEGAVMGQSDNLDHATTILGLTSLKVEGNHLQVRGC